MDALSTTFAALADPTRRAILARLAEGDARVGDLARPLPISLPAVSRHLRVLEGAGLIRREVDAQWRLCRLQTPALAAAHDWLERYRAFWDESLDRLVAYVGRQRSPPPHPANAPSPPQPAPPRQAPRRRTRKSTRARRSPT